MVQNHNGATEMAKKQLTPEINDIIKRYSAVVATKWPITKMIVFGSHAKGTNHEWSDIDVCVVSPQLGNQVFDEMVTLDKLTATIDDRIEPHPMNQSDLNNKYDTLASEIRKYGIQVTI